LALNPGVTSVDYFAEYNVFEFRRALLANLRQAPQASGFPNLWFNPRFSWHSGFAYWHGKLREIIDHTSVRHSDDRQAALRFVSSRVAFLELYPYHSSSFHLPSSVAGKLRSPQLARSFVQQVLLPRARSGRASIVVTRHAQAWGLSPGKGVIVYGRGGSRGAHLTLKSRGGQEVLSQLERDSGDRAISSTILPSSQAAERPRRGGADA